jgi:hypothetical protein
VSEDHVPVIGGNAREIWVAAVLLYGIGDTVTTLWGLSVGGVAEAGPIAKPFIQSYGRYVLVAIKVVVFAGFYLVWRLLRTPGRVAVPFALVLVGGVTTLWNAIVILTAF